ncbi:hypothetical protein ACFOU0_10650 [Salinicoccus sesuvii]|uniref:Uncharacterized protein n=1 Tax=Salinicoccus sesuvii TaxID=868281 RepID=A0ABV7N804_9STAP
MRKHYNQYDPLLGYRENDYEPLQLNVQKRPDSIIEFILWGMWSFIKHLIIR